MAGKNLALFGATGGLGKKLVPYLNSKYNVFELGSKDVDIRNLVDVRKFFETNQIDIVLNFSGVSNDSYIGKISPENYNLIDDMIDVNIRGNINILSACLPSMITQKYGRVIAISSVLSELEVPKTGVYSASKAFIDKLYRVTNKENLKFGVTCNTIRLGYWDGGLCERLDENFREIIRNNIGLKRWGSFEELYNTIDYMIENEYFCGQNLRIDGGI